jgi:hypothetical protein
MRRRTLLLVLGVILGCSGSSYDDDDDSGIGIDDDDTSDADDDAADDDTQGGVIECDQEDFNLNNCVELQFLPFDLSFCTPVDEELTFTANSSTAWDELIADDCQVNGTAPEPPDWEDVMLVGAASRATGCVGVELNMWFLECGTPDQRAYAYVHARDGDCLEEIVLTTAVLVPRSTRPTHFFNCEYVF